MVPATEVAALDTLESRLRRHVTALAGDIGERNVWRPRSLHAAADYIRAELGRTGLPVHAQGYQAYGVRCENLEVVVPGTGRQTVVVGAHYDTVPGSPGADDNASGVAGVIEIAHALAGERPERTIRLVAFVNEESPFFFFGEMGSKVYARAARARGDDIHVMLSLEMLGYYSEAPGSQTYPPFLRWFYPKQGNFIGFVSNLRSRGELRETVRAFRAGSDFPAEGLASPAVVPGVSWSDQLSFWRAGYPGIMVTDTAFHRNPHYHQASDTPGTLDYASMARVVLGLRHTIERLARCQLPSGRRT